METKRNEEACIQHKNPGRASSHLVKAEKRKASMIIHIHSADACPSTQSKKFLINYSCIYFGQRTFVQESLIYCIYNPIFKTYLKRS